MIKHLIANCFISILFLVPTLNKSFAQDKFQIAHQKVTNSFSTRASKPKIYL
jgi:hypothetical protein